MLPVHHKFLLKPQVFNLWWIQKQPVTEERCDHMLVANSIGVQAPLPTETPILVLLVGLA